MWESLAARASDRRLHVHVGASSPTAISNEFLHRQEPRGVGENPFSCGGLTSKYLRRGSLEKASANADGKKVYHWYISFPDWHSVVFCCNHEWCPERWRCRTVALWCTV